MYWEGCFLEQLVLVHKNRQNSQKNRFATEGKKQNKNKCKKTPTNQPKSTEKIMATVLPCSTRSTVVHTLCLYFSYIMQMTASWSLGINFMVNSQEICDFINQCHDPAEAAHVVTEQVMPGFLEAPKLCCKGNAADSWHRLCRCSVCSVGSFSAHGKDKSRKLSYEEMVVYSWCTCLFFFLFVFQRKKKKTQPCIQQWIELFWLT